MKGIGKQRMRIMIVLNEHPDWTTMAVMKAAGTSDSHVKRTRKWLREMSEDDRKRNMDLALGKKDELFPIKEKKVSQASKIQPDYVKEENWFRTPYNFTKNQKRIYISRY